MNRTKAIARQYVSSCNGTPGFTLMEMSIVIVIVGLIAAGVLSGREMVKSSQLRSVISDIDSYKTAVNTFRLKYDCLPGDCAKATQFFGTYSGAGSCSSNTAATPATEADQSTCNGNGDGMVWYGPSNSYTYSYEKNRFWQHLSAAKLVPGTYSGIANMDGGQSSRSWASDKTGWNIPASKWPNTGYTILHPSRIAQMGASSLFPVTMSGDHKFIVGDETRCLVAWTPCAWDILAGIYHVGPVFSGVDAFQLDSKMDDGKPSTGIVTSMSYNVNGCSTTNVATTALYRTTGVINGISADIPICPLFIDAGF